MTIRISFSDKTVRVAVEINGAIESALTELPQRTWVGLTDEEISELIRATHNTGSFVRAIEAKLKEKNCG
jgi:hypothetical protein